MKSASVRLSFLLLAIAGAASPAFAASTEVYAFRSPKSGDKADPKNPESSIYADYLVIQKRKVALFLCAMKDAADFPKTMAEFAHAVAADRKAENKCFQTTAARAADRDRTYFIPKLKMYLITELSEFYNVARGSDELIGITPTLSTTRFEIDRPDYLFISSAGIEHTKKANSKIWTERLSYLQSAKFRGDFPTLRIADFEVGSSNFPGASH